MSHVFISYVRADKDKVDSIVQSFRDAGVRVWLDRTEIRPGQRWRQAIRQAIKEGAFFLACFSPAYEKRQESYMNEELTEAIGHLRKFPSDRAWFIPVILDSAVVPDREIGPGETLQDIQWIDLSEDWHAGIARLLQAVGADPEKVKGRAIKRLAEITVDPPFYFSGGMWKPFLEVSYGFECEAGFELDTAAPRVPADLDALNVAIGKLVARVSSVPISEVRFGVATPTLRKGRVGKQYEQHEAELRMTCPVSGTRGMVQHGLFDHYLAGVHIGSRNITLCFQPITPDGDFLKKEELETLDPDAFGLDRAFVEALLLEISRIVRSYSLNRLHITGPFVEWAPLFMMEESLCWASFVTGGADI